ncbi:proline-rich protein 5-like [Antedon mediterranea]|uniref:proline-rich protein 5-like n=1 Tax=Antedon mediterranea TaxID=105859 RepID=UPI003AF6344C
MITTDFGNRSDVTSLQCSFSIHRPDKSTRDRVQRAVVSVFKGETLRQGQLEEQISLIRVVLDSDIRQFICEYYRKNLLKKCMTILVGRIDESLTNGDALLDTIADIWVKFYTEVLPTLQAIFIPVRSPGLSIKQLTLLAFRDHMVLARYEAIKGLLEDPTIEIVDDFKHMLLVLQGVREPNNEGHFQLETLVSKIFYPYLGTNKVYAGKLNYDFRTQEKENNNVQAKGPPYIKLSTHYSTTDSTSLRARRAKSHGSTFSSSLSASNLETLMEDRKRNSDDSLLK